MTTPASLSYQEILRTIGEVLDVAGSTVRVIHLEPGDVRLSADRANVPEDWSMDALVADTERQRQRREAGVAPTDTPWARLMGWQLRLVGAALDVAEPGPYTMVARPEEILVFNAQGYYRPFRHAALERRAALAPELRGQATTCPVREEPESLLPLVHQLPDEQVLGADAIDQGQSTHRCRHCGASVRLSAPSF